MKNLLTSLFLCAAFHIFAQNTTYLSGNLQWADQPVIHYNYPDGETPVPDFEIWSFEEAAYNPAHPSLPYYKTQFKVANRGDLRVTLVNGNWESFNKPNSPDDAVLTENLQFEAAVQQERQEFFAEVSFIPIRKNASGDLERLVNFELRVNYNEGAPISQNTRDDYTYTSVLADADVNPVYKIAVTETGIHRLSFQFLADLGIDVANINPKHLKIYGNGGGMLPELIAEERLNDLEENTIKVVGEEDGSFDNDDYVLFYAEGPNKWEYSENEGIFNMDMNIYDEKNYYFIKIDTENGKRITSLGSASNTDYTTSEFDDFQRFEEDKMNLLEEHSSAQGTGKLWFGDAFILQRDKDYTNKFNFPNTVTNKPAHVKVGFVGRANTSSTYVKVTVDGNVLQTPTSNDGSINSANLDGPNSAFGYYTTLSKNYTAANDIPNLMLEYPSIGISEGYLDYIQLNVRRQLMMTGDQMRFQDATTLAYENSKFELNSANDNIDIWDITNPVAANQQTANLNGSTISFGANTTTLRQFIAFNRNATLLQAEAVGQVAAQNLHSITDVDLVIVYHEKFVEQAQQLADHRAEHSGMNVALAEVSEIYNEFSSGRQDIGAIRELGKMLYERAPERFRYMLLMGDGSFDARNIDNIENAHNYVPVFETYNSLSPISGFPSDDFFGLISEDEGTTSLTGRLDLGVGRIPVRTVQSAQQVIDKIINYDTSPNALGDWRNRVTFVADNGDGNVHLDSTDQIAESLRLKNKNVNLSKIYIDAFERVATTGDARVPGATAALNRDMFRGVLAVTYLGHGGGKGWAQERILQFEDINSWRNFDRLPVFITATCSFAGFDESTFVTAGERILLNGKGGGVALFTTVRPVFANSNAKLTRALTDTLFLKFDEEVFPIGEVMRVAKNNSNAGNTNSRKFLLLGDPSMKLALPEYNVVTTKINDQPATGSVIDTIRALEKVTIEGEIRDKDGVLMEDFNGIVYPTLFDKIKMNKTLGQDASSPVYDFLTQNNTIFKGRASVTNGTFQFTFVVPKDIDYTYGVGKISYYAADETTLMDASGSSCDVVVGGIDPDAAADDEGPEVEVFMNTWEWVFGGTTSENPTLLVRLADDNGINIVGNSIGHDLNGVLDNNTQNTYNLNDFYEADLDDYTKGTVQYPLSNIPEGVHQIKIKAWDVANNSAEGFTEFVVANSEIMALEHVLNYPNPFVNSTCFMFNYNQTGSMDVQIDIYTINGRLVKTIQENILVEGGRLSRDNCIEWNGRDDFGDRLGTGVYLYKVRLRNTETGVQSSKEESRFEKLVILK